MRTRRVSAPGFRTLVTQMYFRGLNDGTCQCFGCNNPLLQTTLSRANTGVFDIVLAPA